MRYMKDGVSENNFIIDVKKYITMEGSSLEARQFLNEILIKYNIAVETFHYRIRSLFGKSSKELRREYFTPSKESVFDSIRRCATADELWDMLKIPNGYRKGLFDLYFGTSNFSNAKAIAEECLFVPQKYVPSIRDNEALVAACLLGDGYFDTKRSSLKIEHGFKQEDWLNTKVDMLKLAFPYIAGKENIKRNERENTGYVSFSYYSRKLHGKCLSVIVECLSGNYERFFSPLFLWILFLDDGCNAKHSHQICYGRNGDNFGQSLINYLKTFGINAHISPETMSVLIRKKIDRVKFSRILKQFEHMTPENMKYKIAYKV